MKSYSIAVVAGDGIGKEVIPPALEVLEACGERFGVSFQWKHFDWSADYYFQHGRMMPATAPSSIASCGFNCWAPWGMSICPIT